MIQNRYNIKPILLTFFVTICFSLKGQTGRDSVLLTAMQHELKRNMDELHKDDFDKPFFIGYTIADVYRKSVTARLGALVQSGENRQKDWNIRVMVGDYQMNDENFTSNIEDNQANRITYPMPLENDYLGIRRALWSQTDRIYHIAAAIYKQKKSLVEKKKVDEKLLGRADFSKEPTVVMHVPATYSDIDLPSLEERAKVVSEIFQQYPSLYNSNVTVNHALADVYFVNSEGSEVVYPVGMSSISVMANVISDENINVMGNLSYNAMQVDQLPSLEMVEKDISYMVNDIMSADEHEKYDDYYSGPVLLLDDVVVDVLESLLFADGHKLIAHRTPLKRTDQFLPDYSIGSNNQNNWEIGKKILDDDITVIDYSKLPIYSDSALWGSFPVDAEGVVPPDSMVMVENGILRNKYNGRTPADDVDGSNGHNRHSVSGYGISQNVAPGILKITATSTISHSDLKARLIQLAREEGYKYGILIRPAPVRADNAPYEFYKIDVESGKETRLVNVAFESVNDREFMRVAGFSDQVYVKNKLFSPESMNHDNGYMSMVQSGVPVTYMVPSGILLERVDIVNQDQPMQFVQPVVKSPLFQD